MKVSLVTAAAAERKTSGESPFAWSEQRIEQLFVPLEDGRTLHQGWSPQCDKVPSLSEGVWGVLKTTSIQAGEFRPEHNKLLPSKLAPRPLIEVKEGDILLTCAGPRVRCGVSCLVRQTRKRLMMSGKMYRFRVDADRIDPRYIEAFLQTERARLAIDKMKTGSSDSGLNLTHARFRQLLIPVAPLPEQRRIVAEIEKQFTRLEAGVAGLRRVQAKLKRYRASVLKAACEGCLVPTEAELATTGNRKSKFETGEALLARILIERRQNWQGRGQYKEPVAPDTTNLRPLPEGWTWTNLNAAIVSGPQNGVYLPREHYGCGHPILRIDDYQDGWVRGMDELNKVTADRVTADKYQLLSGDLVINRVNSLTHLGKCLVVRETHAGALFESNMMKAHLADGVNPRYVEFYLRSREGRTRLIGGAKWAVNQASINQEDVKRTSLPLPPLFEQTRIVAEGERRLSVVDEFEAVVSANLRRATRLRQSILQKAFAGNLTK